MTSSLKTTATMALPYDIWCLIARFIEPLQLSGLFSLNSALFNIAMDQRYRSISFAYLSVNMLRVMRRLRDPTVARRVRILYIYPEFLSQIAHNEDLVAEAEPSSPSSPSIYTRKFLEIAHLCEQTGRKLFAKKKEPLHNILSSSSPVTTKSLKTLTIDEFAQVLSEILGDLPNLVDYHLSWCGIPSIGDTPARLINVAMTSPALTRLWLDISLERLSSLLSENVGLGDNLEELNLFLRAEEGDVDRYSLLTGQEASRPDDFYAAILSYQLAPAINALRHSLRFMSLRLFQPLELAPLFDALDPLPYLAEVKIDVPTFAPHVGQPQALAAFLNRCAGWIRPTKEGEAMATGRLAKLAIRASQLNGAGLTPIDSSISTWFSEFIPLLSIPLRTLEITLVLVPFESALLCLHQFSSTLRDLVLTGTHFGLKDIERITSVWGTKQCGLRRLKIGSVTLSPEVMDLLADKMPLLHNLELLVRDVIPSEGEMPIFCHSDRDQDEGQLAQFFVNMSSRFYPSWPLDHLSLLRSSKLFRMQFESMCNEILVTCVEGLVVIL
ncbi:hypothetical protein C8J56DRAFT_934147 [Mycena floridula]|nr:hypothetical protein C8J56DRAFT_934147 [Mycena floridula]